MKAGEEVFGNTEHPAIARAMEHLFYEMLKQATKEGAPNYHAAMAATNRAGGGPRLMCHLTNVPVGEKR